MTAVLRVMGLKDERRFGKYHRVLSRAHWSGLVGARILLGLLVALLPDFDSSEYIGGVDVEVGAWRINRLAMSTRSHARKCLDTWNMQ